MFAIESCLVGDLRGTAENYLILIILVRNQSPLSISLLIWSSGQVGAEIAFT